MMQINSKSENGSVNVWMIFTIVLIVLFVGSLAFAGWAYINYDEQKTNVDGKISTAVTEAKKVQAIDDEAKFTIREKEPNREFVGPIDYGRVTFNYPKTWSVYVSNSAASGGTFMAYFYPIAVPAISSTQQFATRESIEQKDFDKVITSYDSLVKKGSLKASSITVNGQIGTRLDGSFTKDIRGSAVIFKIRDKTLTIRTDSNVFLVDFNQLITTIKFVE
jgi:hypothetical protein